jgi:hypothetical protein
MTVWKSFYFKSYETGETFLSGFPVPEVDGVCKGQEFEDCTFHPSTSWIQYQGCTFRRCSGVQYLADQGRLENCTVEA